MQSWSPSGLEMAPHLRWGSHLAHFFNGGDELRDVLVPFFKAGLENNEQCLWVVREPFAEAEARSALKAVMPEFDRRERAGQIEILSSDAWYSSNTKIRPRKLVEGLVEREQRALGQGFAGFRASGNCSWVSHRQWEDFLEYERLVHEAAAERQMICLCSYCADNLAPGSQLQVMERHHLTVPSGRGSPRPRSRLARRPDLAVADEVRLLREEMVRQKRTFDLAMTASQMGTWRYTLADNICVYDENAQRLYGLTEARFLHDEEGVKTKFHPDDLPTMWSRVAAALDPVGDGRYDVEYRVKQIDGNWRWLSAWGLVEFEEEGGARRPVAIAGASRDLTDLKRAEELQRLLLNELNHRIKNVLATIQAVVTQTMRNAPDVPTARASLEQRIVAMAKAHDLLTARSWSGADLCDVVATALQPFAFGQIAVSGPSTDISPTQTLALSMALHELATNATKYGALSRPEGRITLSWSIKDEKLQLTWEEHGGPRVAPPARKGFGTRLLERLMQRDLKGDIQLNYDPAGLRFAVLTPL